MGTSDRIISIIIPTRNREESLRRLLASIDKLIQVDRTCLEVLVVNNNSTDHTAEFLQSLERVGVNYELKCLMEPIKGQSAAINCGFRHCTGEIICLIDDDVVVDSNWLSGLLESYEKSPFDAIQGRVLPGVDPRGRPADPAKLYYYNIPLVDHGEEMKSIRGLTGAHMTFKRAVFEEVGFFNIKLGPGASGFSGDTEFSRRVAAAGFKIGYSPLLIVYHELDPDRFGRKYNRAVQYQKGVSRSIYRRDSIMFSVIPKLVGNLLRVPFYWILHREHKLYRIEGRLCRFYGQLIGTLRRRKLAENVV